MVQSRKKRSERDDKESESKEQDAIYASSSDQQIFTDDKAAGKAYSNLLREVEDYAIFLLDGSGKVLSWNKGAEKVKGYAAEDIIGKNYRIFYTPEDKQQNLSDKMLLEARQHGKAVYEGWRVRKDGTRFWGNVSLTALHDNQGAIWGFLKVVRDVTDKKIAEDNYSNYVEELRLKNEELKKSEERYHKMIQEVEDYAIMLLDREGRILDWNKGAEKLKGYKPTEIIGKSFRLFYPKEEKDSHVPEQLLEESVRKGSITKEGWRIRKDGSRFWGNVTITALHGEDGEVIGFSKLTRDFTQKKVAEDRMGVILEELKQANEHLKQSEERYHQMIAEVQDYAILLLDRNGNIQNWNAGAESIKGYTAQEIIGKNFRMFYPEEDKKAKLPESLLDLAVKYGKATHEGWRIRKDGTRFWGSIVITALHNSKGGVIGFSKVTRDLTERKKADDMLRTSAAQLDLKNKTLERLNEELTSFNHVASHDMKEPLRKIQTYAGRIEAANFDPVKSREFLSKIKRSAEGMQRLIEDLLSYSQMSNDISATFEKVDLNAILKAVISDLEIAIYEKKATINFKKLPVVRGIPYQLRQLFLNLISNALKFSKAEEPPQVTISVEAIKGPELPGGLSNGGNKYLHISVADNGIGFSHDAGDRIFEPFQRLHPKSVFSGSGIGLAIVKKIVDNHGGIVSAEGKPGAGAVFHLYLPA